jgi:hypothetical protein
MRRKCKQCGKKVNNILYKFCSSKCYHISTRGMISPNHHRKGKVIGVPVGTIIYEKDSGYLRIKIGCMYWQRLHRFIMEKYLNRKLKKHEHVHHLNSRRDDNSLTNLVVLTNSEHRLLHFMQNKKRGGCHAES